MRLLNYTFLENKDCALYIDVSVIAHNVFLTHVGHSRWMDRWMDGWVNEWMEIRKGRVWGRQRGTGGGKNNTKPLNAFQRRKTDLAALFIKDINP